MIFCIAAPSGSLINLLMIISNFDGIMKRIWGETMSSYSEFIKNLKNAQYYARILCIWF